MASYRPYTLTPGDCTIWYNSNNITRALSESQGKQWLSANAETAMLAVSAPSISALLMRLQMLSLLANAKRTAHTWHA